LAANNKRTPGKKPKNCVLTRPHPVAGTASFPKGPKPKATADDLEPEIDFFFQHHPNHSYDNNTVVAFVREVGAHPSLYPNCHKCIYDESDQVEAERQRKCKTSKLLRLRKDYKVNGKVLEGTKLTYYRYVHPVNGKPQTRHIRVLLQDAMADPKMNHFAVSEALRAMKYQADKYERLTEMSHQSGCKSMYQFAKWARETRRSIEVELQYLESIKP
jgi:hypothetical protein